MQSKKRCEGRSQVLSNNLFLFSFTFFQVILKLKVDRKGALLQPVVVIPN